MIDLESHAEQIVARYPAGRQRSALIPLLRLAQERDGYLTKQGIEQIGQILGLTPAEVTAVATFCTMLYTKPKGRHVISICHNLACTLAGAEKIIDTLERELGVECGHTTLDGEFTLERAECLAFCDKAPMIQIDYDEMIGPLTTAAALQLLERLKAGLKGPVEGLDRASEGEDKTGSHSRALQESPGAELSPRSEREPSTGLGAPAFDEFARARSGPTAAPSSPAGQPTAAPSEPVLGKDSADSVSLANEGESFDEPLLVDSIELSESEEGLLHREGDEER